MSGGVRAVANRLAARLPNPIADRVLPGRRRAYSAAGVSRPGQAEAPRRLLIAPANSAGQGYAWARTAEKFFPGTSAVCLTYRGSNDHFAFPADHVVPTSVFAHSTRWQREQRRAIEQGFTHVIIESGRQVLDSSDSVLEQLRWLQQHGIHVALLWHGSDIRLPSQHATAEPDSPFAYGRADRTSRIDNVGGAGEAIGAHNSDSVVGPIYPETARLEEIARQNRTLMREAGVPVFVSTPDLLPYAPGATWLPVVIDLQLWRPGPPPLQRECPIVVHAPSNSGLKGSEAIREHMFALHNKGVIEYRELHGVPASQMPEVYGQADIVLDQFSLGIYGVAACEALAAGRIVVSHVAHEVRERVIEQTGYELPVIQTRKADLGGVIEHILADRTSYRALATRGPDFVAAVHDGQRSAQALASFLGVSH